MALSEHQRQHLDSLNKRFERRNNEKYRAGAEEHGGNLTDHGIEWYLDQMEEEVIDMWAYLITLRQKIKGMEE